MAITIKDMPEKIVDWLYSGERAVVERAYLQGLSQPEKDVVQKLVLDIYHHEVNVSDGMKGILQAVPGERGRIVASAVLGADLIRAQDWFSENIEDQLQAIGGDLVSYKTLLNGDEAVDDALRGVNVELIPPRTRDAIFVKMQEFLNGQIEKASLLEAMMKSPKIGGWGWDQDTAIPVIEKLEAHLREAETKHAAFVSKAQLAEIEGKRAETRKMMEGERQIPAVAGMTTEAVVQKQVVVESSVQAVPDPFAFLIQENLPHLADSELNISRLPDPFAALLEELATTVDLPAVPEPAFAYANVTEHRGIVDVVPPTTPFERALHASDILLENELREIEHRKEELMKDVPETAIVVSSTLEALVDRIMDDSKFATSDASLMRRIRNIVSSRLRDIRGSEETARLISKIGQGTRDLNREMVEKIVMLTEQAFLEFQRKVIERGLQRERSRRVREREEVLEQKREEVFNTEKELNDRFKKLTGKDMPLELPKPSSDSSTRPAASLGMTTAPERKVTVTLSPKSVAPAPMQKAAPVMEVQYQRQLAGPIEELRTMRLTDFRRLSKDPKAATEKIMAKVELLGADGYEKKVLGALAWRESPVMKLYHAVTKQALDDATPLQAVLEKKRKEIPEMLTLDECKAIRELNSKLRY